uniref:FBA_2 domain-containing protein n=1 Tax=Panagrellus redivivus TaxID=6233 RepID=A0A7E4VJR5_PANRE
MATLQINLLQEALEVAFTKKRTHFQTHPNLQPSDRLFWRLNQPLHAVYLAIYSDGYLMLAYIIQRFATHVVIKDGLIECYASGYYNFPVISFSDHYYIRSLITHTGRFCNSVDTYLIYEPADYMLDFLAGLGVNDTFYNFSLFSNCPHQTISLITLDYYALEFFQNNDAILKNSDVASSLKYIYRNRLIPFLAIKNVKQPVTHQAFEFLTYLRIESLHILSTTDDSNKCTVKFDFFYRFRPIMEYLRNFRCDLKIYAETVIIMLNRYNLFTFVSFRQVWIKKSTSQSLEVKLTSLRKKLLELWHAIYGHPAVMVHVNCKSLQTIDETEWRVALDKVCAVMPGFRIVQTAKMITCKAEKSYGMKTLKTEVIFCRGTAPNKLAWKMSQPC